MKPPIRRERNYSSQVLDRVMQILNCFDANHAELRFADLVERADLHKSTVYRLLSAMREHGLVGVDEEAGTYHLGLRLFGLGSLAISRARVDRHAHPTLERLVEQTGETSHLCVIDGADVVYVAKVESRHTLRIPSAVGQRNPAYCTGIGKAILAHLPEQELQAYLKSVRFHAFTEKTIVSPERLRAHLRAIRMQGYAIDDEEREEGVRCVAAPVRDHTGGVIAAVSCAGPASRITKDRIAELSSYVVAAASAISTLMGYGLGAHRVVDEAERSSNGAARGATNTRVQRIARDARERRNGIQR